MVETSSSAQDHIFISYAIEDAALAEWLTLKLTSFGYRVWCDRFKLLGGESFPREIDRALKERTCRVVALISKSSVSKPNPVKERTLAHHIGKQRKIDFIIPIIVDDIRPEELDWMIADLTFIPFSSSWYEGLSHLLKKLESLEAPRPLEDGKQAVLAAYLPKPNTTSINEKLYSNCLIFEVIPPIVKHFSFSRSLTYQERIEAQQKWAFSTDAHNPIYALSFHTPPSEIIPNLKIELLNEYSWKQSKTIKGINSNNLVIQLLKKCFVVRCLEKGMKTTCDGSVYYPRQLFERDRLIFQGPGAKKRYIQVAGERSIRVGPERRTYLYHISPSFRIRSDMSESLVAQINIRVYFTDPSGIPLKPRSALSRRKRMSRAWKNKEWLMRHMAVCQFLSDGKERIVIGRDLKEQVVLSSGFLTYTAPYGIDEASLKDIPESEVIEVTESEIVEDTSA